MGNGGPNGGMDFAALANPVALAGNALQMGGQYMANRENAYQADRNRDFQETMSSTAHTREVADLKNAGLNPILSANAGASSPSGGMATMQNVAEGIGQNAQEAMKFSLAAKKAESEIDLLKSQKSKTDVETKALGLDAVKGDMATKIYNKLDKAFGSVAEKYVPPTVPANVETVKKRLDDFVSPSRNPLLQEAQQYIKMPKKD